MNFYGNNYSPYIPYHPYSYYHPYDFNGPNYSYEPNDCYDSYNSSYAQASQYSNAYHDHSFQPYPSQDQSTQSKLHDLPLKMNNDSIDHKKMMQDSLDMYNRISATCDKISKLIDAKNARDTCNKGETYEEHVNQITNLGDEKEESKMYAANSSHQTPLDPMVESEYISKYDDGVISKRDGEILSVYFHDMDQSIKVPNLNPFHDLSCYGDFPSLWLNDECDDEFEHHDDDDIVSIDGVNLFAEETNDALLKDEHIPHMLENVDSLITMSDMHDESDLNAVVEEVPDVSNANIKDMEKNSKVLDSNSIQDLDYFKDDFTLDWSDDEYNNGDDSIFVDELNIFDEETKDTSIEDIIPNLIIHETLDTKIEDESDSHDLNTKDYDLDQYIEKDVKESPTMLPTIHFTSENVIHVESPLLEILNYEYHDPYMISISNEHNDPPIFLSTHEMFDCEIKENESMMSDSHVLEDMKIISDSWSAGRSVEEIPISLPIIPHTPYYQVYDENIILEDMRYEYHDPFLIKRDTNHSFHIPPLSCMHHLFTKISKIFSFSFIIFKIKNYKNITLHEKFLSENLNYIHWEDDFPIFILVYDLD